MCQRHKHWNKINLKIDDCQVGLIEQIPQSTNNRERISFDNKQLWRMTLHQGSGCSEHKQRVQSLRASVATWMTKLIDLATFHEPKGSNVSLLASANEKLWETFPFNSILWNTPVLSRIWYTYNCDVLATLRWQHETRMVMTFWCQILYIFHRRPPSRSHASLLHHPASTHHSTTDFDKEQQSEFKKHQSSVWHIKNSRKGAHCARSFYLTNLWPEKKTCDVSISRMMW